MRRAPLGVPVPGAAAIRAATSGCLAAAVVVLGFTGLGAPYRFAPPALAALVALSELAVVHLTVARQRWTYSCTDAVIAAAFALDPGGWIAVAVAAGILVSQGVRRQPRLKAGYNVAQFLFSTSAAAGADRVLVWHGAGHYAAAAAAMVVFWLVNHAAVTLALWVTGTGSLRTLLVASAPLSLGHVAANASVGILAAWLATHAPYGLLGLLAPVALLWSSFDQQVRRTGEARLFAELARGQEWAAGHSVDLSAQVLVTAAARLLGGADVELLVLGGDGLVLYRGDETGPPERLRVGSELLDQRWAVQALGSPGLRTGTEEGRPSCTAAVGRPDAPLALLVARRAAGAPALDRRDAFLVGTLVRQAESWLDAAGLAASRDAALTQVAVAGEAARALGDLGAHTTPALTLLRDSARRLAALAAGPATAAGPVGAAPGPMPSSVALGIVAELHAAERAVASLLGAVALAAEPDLAVVAPPAGFEGVRLFPVLAPDEGWTSSGVLG